MLKKDYCSVTVKAYVINYRHASYKSYLLRQGTDAKYDEPELPTPLLLITH